MSLNVWWPVATVQQSIKITAVKYVSTIRVTFFRIALELLVDLVDNIWLVPSRGVLKSRFTRLAVVTARVFRHNQISRALAENLITTMSWI